MAFNTNRNNMEDIFSNHGGKFEIPFKEFEERLKKIKVFIFDWDGVFNNGIKYGEEGSLFSDIDAMGVNVLRFSYWLKNKKFPLTYILTGMTNNSAKKLALREHFDGIFINSKFKMQIVTDICTEQKLTLDNIAFVFDDILDLEVANAVGLTFRVRRSSSPLFERYVEKNNIGHYTTANSGANNAVREICELIAGTIGNYDEVVKKRIKYLGDYEKYLLERNSIKTIVVELEEPG
jgi:3-deoxy-D-manno-octulosonate 8-phosphate phosphatase (KDO 8-P phosphatase)